MDEPTVAVLGLPGFRLLEVTELDGEVEYLVETDETVVGCASCGTRAHAKDRREVVLRDLAHGERPVRVRWRKRIWCCTDTDCSEKTWTEQSWLAEPRRHLTHRARSEICRRVGEENVSVARCARAFGVGWHAAWTAVTDIGTPLVEDAERISGVSTCGLDETMFLHARRGRRRVLVTGVVDVVTGRLLDVFRGREAADLRQWMSTMPAAWLDAIEVVSLDPHEGYRSALVRDDPVTGLLPRGATSRSSLTPSIWCASGTRPSPGAAAGPTGHPRSPRLEGRPALSHPSTAPRRGRASGRPGLGAPA